MEQLHTQLTALARLLERADVEPRPEVARGWVDGTDVMEALHISPRTLQTLRSNGTIGYTTLGKKYYYRIDEIDRLLRDNYVMFRLSAQRGGDESTSSRHKKKEGGGR